MEGDRAVAGREEQRGAHQAAVVAGQDGTAPGRAALGHGQELGIGQGRVVCSRGHPGHEGRQRSTLGRGQSVQLDHVRVHVHGGEGNPVP